MSPIGLLWSRKPDRRNRRASLIARAATPGDQSWSSASTLSTIRGQRLRSDSWVARMPEVGTTRQMPDFFCYHRCNCERASKQAGPLAGWSKAPAGANSRKAVAMFVFACPWCSGWRPDFCESCWRVSSDNWKMTRFEGPETAISWPLGQQIGRLVGRLSKQQLAARANSNSHLWPVARPTLAVG